MYLIPRVPHSSLLSVQAASAFVQGVSQISGLEVCGQPDMCVVAIKSTEKSLNIYKVNDLMTQKGWHLNALQFPSSVHMCFTAQHVNVVSELLQVCLVESSRGDMLFYKKCTAAAIAVM